MKRYVDSTQPQNWEGIGEWGYEFLPTLQSKDKFSSFSNYWALISCQELRTCWWRRQKRTPISWRLNSSVIMYPNPQSLPRSVPTCPIIRIYFPCSGEKKNPSIHYIHSLEPCCSSMGPQLAASAHLGAYYKCRLSDPFPGLLNQKLHFNKIPR